MIKSCLKSKSFLFLVGDIFLIVLLILVSNKFFYSDNVFHLIIIFLVAILTISYCFSIGYKYSKNKNKNISDYFLIIFLLGGIFIGFLYMLKCGVAFRYENSYEIYKMSSNFSIRDAKNNKNLIDNIFEKDFDGVFSRDIFIDSYYFDEEENNYVLYVEDVYKNYKLKFFVEVSDNNIDDVYWDYNGKKLYFVEKGEKSSNFEFYYAMYIISEVVGENLKNVVRFEDVVDKRMSSYFGKDVNNMVSYEMFSFNDLDNTFILKGQAVSMDFYGSILEKDFVVSFYKKDNVLGKGTWYYGDSSFDYVDYEIKI